MNVVKTSLLNAIAVIIKMLTLLGINKVLAIYVGPSGYAGLGQFQNAVQMITTLAGGSMNTGVIKYTAEFYDDVPRQHRLWGTAGLISICTSGLISLVIVFFAKELSVYFLGNESYKTIFYWLSGGLILFVLNALLLAILNGKKEIRSYVVANIAGSIISFMITGFLSFFHGFYGALVALSIYQSVAFIVTVFICTRAEWFKIEYLFGPIDSVLLSKLLKFSLMVGVSAVCVPFSNILIRDFLTENYGVEFAGYWEALTRMSGAYLMLITTTLSLYFLPRYSEIKRIDVLKKEVIRALLYIVPIAVLGSGCVFLLKKWLIIILFTEDFLPIQDLMFWQVIGDTLKIASWVLGFLLWARAIIIVFIITEIIFSFGFYFLTIMASSLFGSDGVVIAYAINYFLYMAVLSVFFFYWFRSNAEACD